MPNSPRPAGYDAAQYQAPTDAEALTRGIATAVSRCAEEAELVADAPRNLTVGRESLVERNIAVHHRLVGHAHWDHVGVWPGVVVRILERGQPTLPLQPIIKRSLGQRGEQPDHGNHDAGFSDETILLLEGPCRVVIEADDEARHNVDTVGVDAADSGGDVLGWVVGL